MLGLFVSLQVILVVAVVVLVLLQNSSVDPISTFSNNSYSASNSMNVKPVKNPLSKITWIVSMLFFLNTIALSKVMYYSSNVLSVDKTSISKNVKEPPKEVVDLPFNNE